MRKRKFLFLLAALLMAVTGAWAQETLTVYEDGTVTNEYVPFYGYYADETQRDQMIFPASELADMDGGTITQMVFYIDHVEGSRDIGNWIVSLGETTATTLSGIDPSTPLTEVYSGAMTFNSDETLMTVTFTNGYTYNGGNLLVEFNHPVQASYKHYFFMGVTAEGASYCYDSQRNFLPKTTFTYEAAASDCPKPKNFVASNVTAHTADLSWESDGFAFLLQYKKASDSDWTEQRLDGDEKTYTLTGLSGETQYQAMVAAYSETCPTDPETGDNVPSDWREISFTTAVSCPKPTNLTCSAFTATTATFTWTNGGDETQWVLEYATTSDFSGATSVNIVQNDLASGAYTITGLTAEQTYYARIKADCGDGDQSAWSNTCEFKPSAVQIVTIGSGSGVSAYFPTHPNWNYSYTQQIYTAAEIGVSGAIKNISFKGNKNGTRALVVYMANTSKEAFASTSDYIPIAEATQVFSGNVTFTANQWTTIELDGDGFDYDGSNLAVIVDDNSVNYYMGSTNWAAFNTTNYEALYFYQDTGSPANIDPASPSAQNKGTSQTKNQIILSVLPSSTPKPRNLAVSDITTEGATISWTAPADNVEQYGYQYGLTGGDMSQWVYTNETSVSLAGLTPFTSYTFNVYAEYAEGNSGIASKDFTTEATCPVPAGLAIDINMVATWNEGTATLWNLQYRKSGTEEWTAVNGLTAATYDLSTLTLDATTDYDVQVQADCGGGDLSVWSESVSFTTPCASYDIPYTYGFEDAAPFACWTPITGVGIHNNSSYAHSGSRILRFSGTTSNLVALPQFNEPTNNLRVEFWTRPESATNSGCGTFSVGYMTDITDASTFVAVETYAYNDWPGSSNAPYVKKKVDFVNVPANANIAFRHNAGSPNWYWYVDDVTVKEIPSCLEPTGFAADVTARTATLSWTSDASEWVVAYKAAADEDFTEVPVTENPFTLNGLTPETAYTVKVRTNCGGGDLSEWSDPLNFTTEVAAQQPTSITVGEITPFTAELQWTAPVGDNLESYDIYYSQTQGEPTEETEIQYTGIAAGNTSYTLQNLTQGVWYVYIRAYHGETDGYSAWAVKNFTVPEPCPNPTNLTAGTPTPTSITLNWKAGATWQSAWTVAYATVEDFDADDTEVATYVDVTGPVDESGNVGPFEVAGLESETTYYFKVKGACGDEYGQSEWTNAVSATTLVACPVPTDLSVAANSNSATLSWTGYSDSYTVQYREVITPPVDVEVTYGFEDGTQGWTTIDGDGHGDAWGLSTSGYNSTNCMKASYNSNYAHQDYLVSPQITLRGSFSFYAKKGGDYADKFRVYLSTDGNTNATDFTVELTDGDVEPPTSYQQYTYDLSAYSGMGYVAIVYTAAADQLSLYIDNITFTGHTDGEYGEWNTYNDNVEDETATITGLDQSANYDVRVKANCGEDYSNIVTFTTPDAPADITLNATADNASWITANDGVEWNVTLGRTLQTGGWNTFTVPFGIGSEKLTALGITEVKQLQGSTLENETLTLNFDDATSIEAGKPYLVKVSDNVENPTFENVTIADGNTAATTTYADFVPAMNPMALTGGDKSVLFVTGGNTLTYPADDGNINGFRAYFQLHDLPESARTFRMSFDGDVTGITTVSGNQAKRAEGTYMLDGRRINGQPKQKGVYIVDGKKKVKR